MNLKEWQPNKIKFLIIGDTGSGKTKGSGTFPKPYLFSFDGGVDTLAGKDIDYDVYIETNRAAPSAFTRFKTDWTRVLADPRYETVILDNITNLSKYILDQLIFDNRLVDLNLGDKTWDLFRILKNKMYDVVAQTVAANKHIVCTALPEWETDKSSGEMRVLPSTEGRFRQDMPSWFGEVYYAQVEKKSDGTRRYYYRTKSDGKYIAKSRLDEAIKARGGKGLPEMIDNFSFVKIMDMLATPITV